MSDNAAVPCASYWNMLDAHIAKGRLQAEGIPAFLDNEHFVTADWFVNIFVGGVRVLVPPSFAVQAAAVLEQIEQGEFSVEDDAEPPV